MSFLRQIWTLTWKNILVVLFRHAFSTPLRAFLLPVVFSWFLSYARNLFIPPSTFGIGTSTPVRSLSNAFDAASGGRNIVAFVNNGFTGGDIDKVINEVSDAARADGKTVQILSQEEELLTVCRNSLRGVSFCIAGVVFYSSPTEGPGGMWNYTIRADGALATKIDVNSKSNDQEIFVIPIQHAIDFTIASLNTTIDSAGLPAQVMEYPYTSETAQQRRDDIRTRYMGGIIEILAVAFFIGICGVTYQLVGTMASERELGMSQLIECMMPNIKRWQPQVARMLSYHIAFDIIYLPGWIAIAIILAYGVFSKTSAGILIVFHLLAGLSLSSFSIFGASFFKKAQLSGISVVIISLLLAVLAQVIHNAGTGAVAILGLLFPPMNYVFFVLIMARFERQDLATDLVRSAPENPSTLPGIALWIFLIIQTLVYPVFGGMIENWLYGTSSKGRILHNDQDNQAAVELTGFTKRYDPSWFARNVATRFGKKTAPVVAVDNLNLVVLPGQISVLLGANGSGKSTTLEAIAGLNTVTSGTLKVDGRHGIGLCPQKNVIWSELTVEEHLLIFNRLKSSTKPASKTEIHQLIRSCDLDRKLRARAKTLSGGQLRKLQLSMMFTGGSRVCCVDECSSGVDALARRKLIDIILAERSRSNRTFIFTTHFLDEADLLSDYIVILSKGSLKAEGTAPQIKHSLGNGYRVHLFRTPGSAPAPEFAGVARTVMYDQTIYTVPDSAEAASFISKLEGLGLRDYQINGPTIEDAFMKVAEEMTLDNSEHRKSADITEVNEKGEVLVSEEKTSDVEMTDTELQLLTGKHIGPFQQGWVLFRKRFTVLQRNWLPSAAAFLIPVIAAGLVTLFLKSFTAPGCSPIEQVSISDISSLITQSNYDLVVGPSSKIGVEDLKALSSTLPGGLSGAGNLTALASAIHMVETLDGFNDYINQNYQNVTPGGFFLGDGNSPPTFAYQGNGDISLATITQNAFDTLLTNISISTQYSAFDVPWAGTVGNSLQLVVYFGLAMSCAPAFFALYPTMERLRSVRALHYSNGVRALPLWLAYISFDFILVLASSVLAIVIFVGVSHVWYGPAYLFITFFCYGLASTLLAYVVSLFARSQLAAFAFTAGGLAVSFLLYFIAYLSTLTYSPTNKIDSYVNIVHFTVSAFFPTGNLIRAMLVSLNIFSITCRDRSIAPYPGAITLYGGPILYLLLQSFFLFGVLLWFDSGFQLRYLLRRATNRNPSIEDPNGLSSDVAAEVVRVTTARDDGLRVLHLTKSFSSNVAVQDLSFGVKRGEVFALLGPNGAGKSTTISLIRGDIRPSNPAAEIFIENVPLSTHRASARQHLGVCPQFDAMDTMTALEHLRFYARIRGVADVEHNSKEVLKAVGLEAFAHRMAAKLSGGNKRKMSLGIALMGNPSVMLLDEPSSGMDVAAKRLMWRTLASIVPGRSIVLTTHSMEEADALATRAGIMAGKMLAVGTSEGLRQAHGARLHVHVLLKSAPWTSEEEGETVREWVSGAFEGVEVEKRTFHGQVRWSVPASSNSVPAFTSDPESSKVMEKRTSSVDVERFVTPPTTPPFTTILAPPPMIQQSMPISTQGTSTISTLFSKLEAAKADLGFEYYSVSQTTLDQVFLSIVGRHNVEEEGYAQEIKAEKKWRKNRKERGKAADEVVV